jgi:hypothetical protein
MAIPKQNEQIWRLKLKYKDVVISDSNYYGYKDLRDRKVWSRSIDILRDLFVYAGGAAYTIVRDY